MLYHTTFSTNSGVWILVTSCICTRVLGGDQGRLFDEADMVISTLETSVLQAQRTQTLLRKRHKGKGRLLEYEAELVSLVSYCKLMHIKYSLLSQNLLDVRSTGTVY
jgi:hypothetical protein